MTDAERNRLVEEHLPLARSLAARYAGRIDYEDLVQAGALGLIRAADMYRAETSVSFATYAYHHVRAAIVSCLRELDHLSRRLHAGRPRMQTIERSPLLAADCPQPADVAEDNEAVARLYAAVDSLPPRDQALAVMVLEDGHTPAAAARLLGISRQRAHQILRRIRTRLTRIEEKS